MASPIYRRTRVNGEWQETDLTVCTLLIRSGRGWRLDRLGTLPDDEKLSLTAFEKRRTALAGFH